MDELEAVKPVECMAAKEGAIYLARAEMNPDEPVFILRGRDVLAPAAVFAWARLAERYGVGVNKLAGALDAASKMLTWPGRRMPD